MTSQQKEILALLDRDRLLFQDDLEAHRAEIDGKVRDARFLVLGGAGSIGQAVVKELFARSPRRLHVMDTSENNLVELVRDVRSSYGYIEGDFETFPLTVGSNEYKAFIGDSRQYDYVLNFLALKHVRSEKDAFGLMRMLHTNVLLTRRTMEDAAALGCQDYFAVSSDKAANPANAMGASKRAMELCLTSGPDSLTTTSARFANVAFSDGSLLYGFTQRLAKRQPFSAPEDIRRFLITKSEAAVLCLFSFLLGKQHESCFPNASVELRPTSFSAIAERFLAATGYEAFRCESEDEARSRVEELAAKGRWPCYFFKSDTTGEKNLEEFFTQQELLELDRYSEIGVVKLQPSCSTEEFKRFLAMLGELRASTVWSRETLITALENILPEFQHKETGRFLESRM